MKRSLKLRNYQIEPSKYALDNNKVVLGLAPNAGKTEISIYVIGEYLRNNPKAKVLFLAHSTNVIKHNLISRMDGINLDFIYSDDLSDDSQVHVCLPNSEDKMTQKYDFLIVDEAHENYHAKRVQRIIKDINPSKELLLTGTPEKFIDKGGYDIYCLAANEISDKWFAQLNIELVASNYDWKDFYNNDLNVSGKFNYLKKDTRITMENVISSLLNRFKKNLTPDEYNKVKTIPKIKQWFKLSKTIGKTLITCFRTKQADQIYKILKDQGVNVGISHSKTDLDSEEIEKFKQGEYDIMVVVNRARLGYSDDNLMNVIDISGTHNPSLIYQTFARALRGSPNDQKYYLKVTPVGEGQMDLTHTSVCAALMLTDKQYLSTYNGKNFNGIVIPVVKKSKKRSSKSKTKKKPVTNNTKVIFPEYTNDVIDTFKNIIHDLDKTNIYKWTTIGEVRKILGVTIQHHNGYWTKEKCQEAALRYTSKPEFRKYSGSAYEVSKRNKWLDEICSHMEKVKKPNGYWTKEKCHEEALKYRTRNELRKHSSAAYSKSLECNWLNDICKHMDRPIQVSKGYWTKEKCHKEVLKYKSRFEFQKKSVSAYEASKRNKWLDEICSHMEKVRVLKRPAYTRNYWTKEKCHEEALKCNTKIEFRRNYSRAFGAACRNKWIDEVCSHMTQIRKPNNYWTKEKCHEEALKHQTRTKFQKGDKSAYNAARKNNWIDEFFPKNENACVNS